MDSKRIKEFVFCRILHGYQSIMILFRKTYQHFLMMTVVIQRMRALDHLLGEIK